MQLNLLLLSLAAGIQAWPQLPNDPESIQRAKTLAALAARSLPFYALSEEDPLNIINVKRDQASEWLGNEDPNAPVHASRRGLPVLPPTEDILGVPSKRALPVLPPTEDILGVPSKRALPVLPPTEDILGVPTKRETETKGPGFITFPLIHAESSGLVKRSFEMTIENRTDLAYYAPLKIGNPPQEVYAQVDTGSFELWVDPTCTGLTGENKAFCENLGQYEVDQSTTAKSLGTKNNIKYGKGSASIAYHTDNVAISDDVVIKGLQFGVADSSLEQAAGVLGLGKGQGAFVKYNTFLDELVEQGLTKTAAFSVGLGAKGSGAGVIAFGGVDTKKYSGKLAKLPIISPGPDGIARYWVNMKSVSKRGSNGKTDTTYTSAGLPVFLDTGATLSLLPPALVKTIADDLGSPGLDTHGFYTVDCEVATRSGSIDFEFEGVTIKVSYPEIIRQIGSTCWLGITPSEKFSLLGDTVMRSMYAVFDTDGMNIHLAQYNNCGTDIKTINKSSDIDGFKGSCGEQETPEPTTSSKSSAAPSLTQPPKSVTTLITTTSGSSAVVITTAVVPTTSSEAQPTPEVESPEGQPSDDSSSGDNKNKNEGSDDKGSDDKGSDDKGSDDKTEGETGSEGSGEGSGNGSGGDSAAGKMTPLSVLASAVAGFVMLMML